MSMIANILNVVGTFLEAFFLYRIVDTLFEKRHRYFRNFERSQVLTGLMIGCYALIVLGLNQVALTSPYTMVVLFIQNILCISIFWKCDIPGAVAVVGGYLLMLFLLGGTEVAITGVIGGKELIQATTMEQGAIRVIYLLIALPILCGINQLFYIWLKKYKFNGFNLKHIAYISFVGFVGCTFLQVQMLNSFNVVINTAWYVLLVAVSAILFTIYFITKSRHLHERLRQLDAQNEILERNYEQLSNFYSTNAKLYHDMNHHLNAMYYMLQNDDGEQAKKYIESIKEPIDTFAIKARTSIDVLDVILYESEKKASNKGVAILIDANILPQDIAVEKKDLCALLSNLLDNALEAAQKEVTVLIKMVQGQLLLQVQNDYLVEPVRKAGHFVTTKADKLCHGYGTQNIKYVIEKYNGSIDYEIQDGSFRVDVMFQIHPKTRH